MHQKTSIRHRRQKRSKFHLRGAAFIRRPMIQPSSPLVRIQNHRHPIVNRRHDPVGRGGQNRNRFERPLTPFPTLPDSRKHEECLIRGANPERNSFAARSFPFVEKRRGNQTATFSNRRLEGRLLEDRLTPGIDHSITHSRIGSPARNQPPPEQIQAARDFIRGPQHQYLHRRREIQSWRRTGPCSQRRPEQSSQFKPRDIQRISPAHARFP